MAIDLRSSSSVGGGTRTNTTITAPSGIQNDDILICHMYNRTSASAVSAPDGSWAQWSSRTHALFNTWYTQTFWKRASGESGDYTFTHASAWVAAFMACWTGAETSEDPIDSVITYAQGSNGGGYTPVAPSISNTYTNSMNIIGHSDWNTGLTVTEASSGYLVVGSVDNMGMLYAAQASAGASGTKTYACAGSVQSGSAHWSIKEPQLTVRRWLLGAQ